MKYISFFFSDLLGEIGLASDGEGLSGVCFSGQSGPTNLRSLEKRELPLFREAKSWLACYFSGKNPGRVPFLLNPKGTSFQQQVWTLLLEIPYGTWTTYGELARQISPACLSAQAVGQAVGKNPVPIFIPCHRVLGVGNKLVGYAGGIDKKKKLLQLERRDLFPFS